MVFSQTSQTTHSILKVVEIDRLKAGKNQQVNGLTGVVTHGNIGSASPPPMATTSFSEEYLDLKPEPLFESTMFHDTDCEFFQDLVQWCSDPAKEEQVQTIDPANVHEPSHTDTIHTQFSPQGWDAFSVNSPTAQASYYNLTPNELSPNIEGLSYPDNKFLYPLQTAKALPIHEPILDISSLPVVIGDLVPEKYSDTNSWLNTTESVNWNNTHDTDTFMHNNTMSFINQEDSTDIKYTTCVIPREVESNNVVIGEFLINEDISNEIVIEDTRTEKRGRDLAVDVSTLAPNWPADIISTPEVLNYVEQLENKDPLTSSKPIHRWPSPDSDFAPTDTCAKPTVPTPLAYEPVTPKSESHTESETDARSHSGKRTRHDSSEDSDETYTPDSERTPRKYNKRRKPNVPIKDMILALEGSQQLTKARRGRPPKRRESTVSSVCSLDDNSSISTDKYRELRDKNNEASKRSRMNRKLKELQMEQLVVELEERNKKLKVRAQTLEEMTKRLKEAFMTAILKK